MNMKPLLVGLVAPLILIVAVTGCSNMKVEDFAAAEPELLIEDYFDGRTRAWGIFEDRFGNLRRQFVVDIEGTWDGKELTLDEDFLFSDGETDRRIWKIVKQDDHRYEGRSEDILGTAQGESRGNAFNWTYVIDLKVGDDKLRVRFDDWMFLQPDGVLLNRARVTKWGVEVGQVTLVFQKSDWQGAQASDARPERRFGVLDGGAVAR